MNLTKHAKERFQQRNIPPLVVEWLMEFGAIKYSHGAEKRFFDKEAKKKLRKAVGTQVVDRLGNLLDIVIVVGDDERIVTGARRLERIRRH